jgi:hypothetical protein
MAFYVGTATIDLTQSDEEQLYSWCTACAFIEIMLASVVPDKNGVPQIVYAQFDPTAIPIRFIAKNPLPPMVVVVPDKNGNPQLTYEYTKGKQLTHRE